LPGSRSRTKVECNDIAEACYCKTVQARQTSLNRGAENSQDAPLLNPRAAAFGEETIHAKPSWVAMANIHRTLKAKLSIAF
jgi:hypothetical protein